MLLLQCRRFISRFLFLLILVFASSECYASEGIETAGDALVVLLATSALGGAAYLLIIAQTRHPF